MNLLVIDVGNTNMKTVLFRGRQLQQAFKAPTTSDPALLWPEVERRMEDVLRSEGTQVAVSTVVKDVEVGLRNTLSEYCRLQRIPQAPSFTVIGRDTKWPLASEYSPGLGTDRMLAAVGAVELYGSPVIVVDIGSAVTVDLVSADRVFKGGIILPGAKMRLRALNQFSSALPEVPIPKDTPPLIGKNTVECISSGVNHGMREEIKGLVSNIQAEAGQAPAVLTGEGSRLFRHQLPQGWHIDDWIVPRGICSVVMGEDDV